MIWLRLLSFVFLLVNSVGTSFLLLVLCVILCWLLAGLVVVWLDVVDFD